MFSLSFQVLSDAVLHIIKVDSGLLQAQNFSAAIATGNSGKNKMTIIDRI